MGQEFDLGVRIQALTLHSEGMSRAQIAQKTGYKPGGISNLVTRAKSRGYRPGGPILLEYVQTAAGRGRKPILTEAKKDEIIELLTASKGSDKFTTQALADEFNAKTAEEKPVSRSTVLRCLKEKGVNYPKKRTTKPGMMIAQCIARFHRFCLEAKDWASDQWKLIVWSDETSACFTQPSEGLGKGL
ncbi:hypothetical protein F5Y10DRAFT_262983 [Nemania abortiva]|nr:hypothetical protein F5Y10DRAFT_262983 [Nemania abortiva]